MRFLFLLISFFALEGVAFASYAGTLTGFFGRKWPATLHSDVQRDALLGIQRIRTANMDWQHPKQFILGPSSAVPYWEAAKSLPPERRETVVSLISGSQVLVDAVRLVDKMQVPGSTVVLVVTAHKFANMWFDRTMIETHYLNGAAGKYMLESPTFDAMWAEYRKTHEVKNSVWTQPHWRMFRPFMAFAYFVSDFVDEKIKRPVSRLKTLFPVTGQSAVAPAFSLFPSAQAAPAPAATPAVTPTETTGSDYEGLTDFKLKEFRVWRDFSKTQFDESIDQSFKMLELLISMTKEKRLKLVIAEAPMSEVEEAELLPFLKDYRRRFNEISQKHPGVTFIQHDSAVVSNNQKYFLDYVHINKTGQDFYHDYLLLPFDPKNQCHRYVDLHYRHEQGAETPKINWGGRDILNFGAAEVIRNDLVVEPAAAIDAAPAPTSMPQELRLGNLKFSTHAFVDTLTTERTAAALTPLADPQLSVFDSKGAEYVTVNYVTPPDRGATLAFQWSAPDAAPDAPPMFEQFGRVATPFIWSLDASDVDRIADMHCINVPEPFLHPGFTWTQSEFLPLPKDVAQIQFLSSPGIANAEIRRAFPQRHYTADRASASSGNTASFELPARERSLTGAKIAATGLEMSLDGVTAVHVLSTDLALTTATSNFRRRLGSFAPHTLGVRLLDGSTRTLNVGGAELIDLAFNAEAHTLQLSLFTYHAHERLSFGYDLKPSKVRIDGGTVHMFRHYRNQAITDFVPPTKLQLAVSTKAELAFPVWQPNGRVATVTFVEHADFQETEHDPLVMYGNAERRVTAGQGVIGNKIPYTKTVFMKGDPLAFPTAVGPLKLNFKQPTVASDEKFAADLASYVATGFVEIGAHQSGTTPFANQHGAAREALTLLKSKYNGRIWTDHGGIPSNLSFNGWDKRQSQFYILDALEETGMDYAWPGTDISPMTDPDAVGDDDPDDYSLNMVRNNEANPILFDLPMLAPAGMKRPHVRFFSTLGPTQTVPLSEKKLSLLVKGRGISLLHIYPGNVALDYKLVDDKKIVRVRPEWNDGLKRLAKMRDEGLLYVGKTSDWLDYVGAMRRTGIVRTTDDRLMLLNSGPQIKGASIGVVEIPAATESGNAPCGVRYYAVDAATGSTEVKDSSLVRTLPCGRHARASSDRTEPSGIH